MEDREIGFWSTRLETNRVQDLINYGCSDGEGRGGCRPYTWAEVSRYLLRLRIYRSEEGPSTVQVPQHRDINGQMMYRYIQVEQIRREWHKILRRVGATTMKAAMGIDTPTYQSTLEPGSWRILARETDEGYEYVRKVDAASDRHERLTQTQTGNWVASGVFILIPQTNNGEWAEALRWGTSLAGKAETTYPHPRGCTIGRGADGVRTGSP